VHLDLASNYRLIKTSTLNQADLLRARRRGRHHPPRYC